MGEAFLKADPLSVRFDPQRITKEALMDMLEKEGVTVREIPDTPCGLYLSGFDHLAALSSFRQGYYQVQDVSSMQAALWADPKPGDEIIDVCAAPGGKAIHLAELLSGTGHVEARDLTEYKVGETMGFPEDNTTDTLNEVGSVVIPTSLSQSVQALHQFLFGNDGYAVSSTVQEIESGISVRAADRATSDSYVEEEETYDYSGGTSNSTGTTDWSNSTGGGTDWTGGTGTGGGTDWTGGTGTGGGTGTDTGGGTGTGGDGTGSGSGTDTGGGTGTGDGSGTGDGTAPVG